MNRISSMVQKALVIALLAPALFGALACEPAGGEASGRSRDAREGAGECVPSRNPEPVADRCGVFVRLAGDDAHEGTKSRPVAKLARAIELAAASGRSVYACAEVFNESVGLPDGITIYGGLRCEEGWLFGGPFHRTILAGEPAPERERSGAEVAPCEEGKGEHLESGRSAGLIAAPRESNAMQILAKAALRPSDESGPSRDLSNLPESVVLGAGAEAPGTEAEDPAPAASADGVANVPEGAAALVPFDVDTSAPWSGGMND